MSLSEELQELKLAERVAAPLCRVNILAAEQLWRAPGVFPPPLMFTLVPELTKILKE